MARAFFLSEPYQAKICSALAAKNCHNTVVLDQHLKMPIDFRLLPKRINVGRTALLHDNLEADRLSLEELHMATNRAFGRPAQ